MSQINPETTALHTLNPLNRFSERAEDYVKYRPSYPADAIDIILEGLGENSQLVATDIGAGTGIDSRLLAERGVNVIAIEPNAAMREAAKPHPLIEFRGLQFWRRYIESRLTTVNAYFRFVTTDLFTWKSESNNLPKDFFDFIVISHCFFADPAKRVEANNTYKQIFAISLKNSGYVLLIVQDKKLFKVYDVHQVENQEQEKNVVHKFLAELELELVWYKYLTSTGSRTALSGAKFAKFAQDNLPKKLYMTPMLQQYFGQKHQSNYTLDDYVILAKK
ncbi:MAG: methyltransferase domain-containing protein [Nostoc sp. NMS7]|uniref:class I SAM-dependent methyltransferase n=1 Tax=Nostoc sp. NMS7 TaxID=2815391 RepID=UPI0025DD4B70|nr:methyltransferase domain-containing protein [Nostoc sp. NMS7]MBN3947811.1 methyltransferase domain-containing protein [Nostoc sp. NMS7]